MINLQDAVFLESFQRAARRCCTRREDAWRWTPYRVVINQLISAAATDVRDVLRVASKGTGKWKNICYVANWPERVYGSSKRQNTALGLQSESASRRRSVSREALLYRSSSDEVIAANCAEIEYLMGSMRPAHLKYIRSQQLFICYDGSFKPVTFYERSHVLHAATCQVNSNWGCDQ